MNQEKNHLSYKILFFADGGSTTLSFQTMFNSLGEKCSDRKNSLNFCHLDLLFKALRNFPKRNTGNGAVKIGLRN